MTSSLAAAGRDGTPVDRLAHVRWIAGGTGAGKSTLAGTLARRHDALVYGGDRAEHAWPARCTPERHPHLHALAPGRMWVGRSPREVFRSMPGLHGETIGFVVEDLLALPGDRIVLVDYFGVLPRHIAPLLFGAHQAVFLLPSPDFRRRVLTARYADHRRARATWGSQDPAEILPRRLARDACWDEEVRRQAGAHGLRTIPVDGGRSADALADEVAAHFRLSPAPQSERGAG